MKAETTQRVRDCEESSLKIVAMQDVPHRSAMHETRLRVRRSVCRARLIDSAMKREIENRVSENPAFDHNVSFLKSLTVLLSASTSLTLVSTRMERISKMMDDSFMIALFDSTKEDETKIYELCGK